MQIVRGPGENRGDNRGDNRGEEPEKEAAEAADMQAFAWLLYHNRPELPVIFKWLVGINVAAFVALLPLGGGLIEANSSVHLAWGANFGPAIAGGQYWRLLTAAFLHFGLIHLGFNMMALWSLGGLAERLYGRWPFLVIYLGAAVIGSLASVYFSPDRTVSAGASGAIFGLGGALASFWLRNGKAVPLSVLRGQWVNLALFIGFSVYMGITATGIDNAAHGGGFVGGALLGYLLTAPLQRPGIAGPRQLGLGIAAILLALAVILPILPEPAYRYPAEQPIAEAIDNAFREDARLADVSKKLNEERTKLTPQAYRQRIESELLEPWREVARSLNGYDPRPESRLAERLLAAQNYAGLRVKLYESYAAGLRGDRARLREAEAIAEQLKPAIAAIKRSLEPR
ncbi:MAG: rhomboid family intramembrane serine protease [Ferrovibrio sp.]|nr:rhomboid family intramembrane serine protease [Ferrovibrio sp.]